MRFSYDTPGAEFISFYSNMLANLPPTIVILLLMIVGAVLGAFINRAIYHWAMIRKRPISPWLTPAEGETARTPFDRIPVLGWIGRGRDSGIYGKGFWIRPMLIELVWIAGLPWFYFWQTGGGLTGGGLSGGAVPLASWGETWFFAHTILLVLMCIGTFIDFDEKTIPDEVTIPGTLIALLFAAFAPWFRLPEVSSNAGGFVASAASYRAPEESFFGQECNFPSLHQGSTGLIIALVIYAIWVWALFPKLSPFYVGLKKSIRFSVAFAIQPKRKSDCAIRTRPRETPRLTIILCVLFVIGMIAIALAWAFLPAENWKTLFGSLVGIAFAGGMIWLIRIFGTIALQQEAMGFGDVTLWAMVGAFLGWQASLVGFFFAPFAGLIYVAIRWISKREPELPFGPFLCFGATVALFWWFPIWQKARGGTFRLGIYLWYILFAGLAMMVVMLLFLAWRKGMFSPIDDEEESNPEASAKGGSR